MAYYYTRITSLTYEGALEKVQAELKKEGFGVITEIDVKETLKKKINVEFRKYKIIGACNPMFAHEALQLESRIGTLLPCNVIVQELADGRVEVSAINPLESMKIVGNPSLQQIGNQVAARLESVVQRI
jgi:uncharacterized protein (DUF302 family)